MPQNFNVKDSSSGYASSQNLELYLYGNVLINSEVKRNAILHTLPMWLETLNAPGLLRVRGEYAIEVKQSLTHFRNLIVIVGDDFLEWRKQTFEDLLLIESDYVFLFNEDHMPIMKQADFFSLFNEIKHFRVDIFQYSWFQQYQQFRLGMKCLGSLGSDKLISIKLSKRTLRQLLKWDRRWVVSLTCIYNRSLLLRILGSVRPIWRTKDPRSPHDVEQRPESTFFLPLIFGTTTEELGVALDDDNTVANSSAISRGLYNGERSPRGENHDSIKAPISRLQKLSSSSPINHLRKKLPSNVKASIYKFLLFPNSLFYTLQVHKVRSKDSRFLVRTNYRDSTLRKDLSRLMDKES